MNPEIMRNEKGEPLIGRLAGGKYLNADAEEIDSDCGKIKTVDCDMPLTLTETIKYEDKEYIVLNFATGDKENPFNWNPWYKRSITTMLNLMTLFIGQYFLTACTTQTARHTLTSFIHPSGLATTAYSSGIDSMCTEFGVPTIMVSRTPCTKCM